MFKRDLYNLLKTDGVKFPVIGLLGPRQSGKTTLLKSLFPSYSYISLESPDMLEQVESDPRGFFIDKDKNWIIDEAHNSHKIFSYIQEFVDDSNRSNKFVLSGSQNFLLHEKISQSLAGRIALYQLLPLTYREYCTHTDMSEIQLFEFLFKGQYPRPYQEHLPIKKWWESYIQTYIEKDVRSLINIRDLSKFRLFVKLCAGYHGQQLNAHQISIDLGLSQTTVHHWLSILEASYIIFRLLPYYKNHNKRLVKTPKLFFFDSGLVCHLLGIESSDELMHHKNRGDIFEGYVIVELIKTMKNFDKERDVYYWKTQQGKEIDLIIDSNPLKILEIKSGVTFQKYFVDNLLAWQLDIDENAEANLIYASDTNSVFKNIPVTGWKSISKIIV